MKNNDKLSGVYLQQRQPFGKLKMLTWLLPYHQSLKIRLADGTVRHIGLAKSKIDKMINSEFTSHDTEEYKYLNEYEFSGVLDRL